jgi:serine phosphatase RsbU (regulator of sigma subunit)/Tfp pilus assembly protein PilF
MKKALLNLILLIISTVSLSQKNIVDSLKIELTKAKDDTNKVILLNKISREYINGNLFNDANPILEKSIDLSKKLNFKKGLAHAFHNLGVLHMYQSNYTQAISNYNNALDIRTDIKDIQGIAATNNNLGMVFYEQGDFDKALNYHFKALKSREEIKDKKGIADSYNNIGNIYLFLKNYDEALKKYTSSLRLRLEIQDKYGESTSYNNIALCYYYYKKYDDAISMTKKAITISENLNDKLGLGNNYNNLGLNYYMLKNYPEAIKNYAIAIKIREELGNKSGVAAAYINLGSTYFMQKNGFEAKKAMNYGLNIALQTGNKNWLKQAYKGLYDVDSLMGNYKSAINNYKLYVMYSDSIVNEESDKEIMKSQMQYNFDKKAAADSIKVAEEKKVTAAQLKQEKTQRFALYGGLALVLVFAGFMFNRFRITQKQKHIIELKEKETQLQKSIIEEKHKEITDSINYAERIQRSFLATKELLDDNLKDYFVFFKPKDVVSGDFYWCAKLSNGNFAIATADSTGHGVPGAIMSLLNVTSLEKAIEHYTNPADILNHTRQTIIERLKKDGSEEGGKDGMDCSLLVFDFVSPFEGGAQRAGDVAAILHIAAANNPVWIIRSNSPFEGGVRRTGDIELIEIKPDKMPVGKNDKQDQSFTTHTVELQKGDMIYTLTDGFPDQFGGEKGKKFMSKKLKELLLANVHLPIAQQKELLDSTFKNWVGDLEQVDDVTVVGIRI